MSFFQIENQGGNKISLLQQQKEKLAIREYIRSVKSFKRLSSIVEVSDYIYSLWSLILTSLLLTFWNFLCDPRRTRRFCTRVGPVILEYHPIDEYKLQSA